MVAAVELRIKWKRLISFTRSPLFVVAVTPRRCCALSCV
jgi:hypothetical protein